MHNMWFLLFLSLNQSNLASCFISAAAAAAADDDDGDDDDHTIKPK